MGEIDWLYRHFHCSFHHMDGHLENGCSSHQQGEILKFIPVVGVEQVEYRIESERVHEVTDPVYSNV